MIFRIKFISEEVDGFVREITIDSEATFLTLNKAILDSCGYPDDQMTSFYVCNDDWERGQQITREDMGVGSADEDIYVMESTTLSEFIEDEGQHLSFVFDPFEDRCFYLDVVEAIPGKSQAEPAVVRSKGKAPKQINELDLDIEALAAATKKKGAATYSDYDEANDLYSDSGEFNDDEIDLEGFEFTDGQPF